MTTLGIEAIAKERSEQLIKHGRTRENDLIINTTGQLAYAAGKLSDPHKSPTLDDVPDGWDLNVWKKMIEKNYKERVIIAGALLAAEVDRLIMIEVAENSGK